MPLDIDGAGRSRSLACLPTARGTVVLLRTSTYKVNTLNPAPQALAAAGWFFCRVDPRGGSGGAGPLLRANFRSSSKFITRSRGLQGPPGASRVSIQALFRASMRPPQSRSLQEPPRPPQPSNCPPHPATLKSPAGGLQGSGASSRGLGGLQEPLPRK